MDLALYAERKHKKWLESPEARLFGERAKEVLPEFMKHIKITDHMIEEVNSRYKEKDGSWRPKRILKHLKVFFFIQAYRCMCMYMCV